MEKISTWLVVVAAALISDDGRVLMQRRPPNKQHGGLWEFPGGKMEAGETPSAALVREIDEELGIVLQEAALFAISTAASEPERGDKPIVLLLYGVRCWGGEPQALEQGCELKWVSAKELADVPTPPLDIPLAQAVIPLLEGVAKAGRPT